MKKLVIGIHPDRTGKESYSDKWIQFLQNEDIETRILDLLAPNAFDQVVGCDGIMWRWTHNPQDKQSAHRILQAIELNLGIHVYPNFLTTWHYDEKLSQYYLLKAINAPVPKTWVFWRRNEAIKWAHDAIYPLVFKLSTGASSSNVLKVDNETDAINLINKSFNRGIFPYTMNEYKRKLDFTKLLQLKNLINNTRDAIKYILYNEYPPLPDTWWKPERNYVLFQEFLPNNDFDTRITIIGNRAFGFRRINRKNDFRASGSGNICTDPSMIDKRCIEIAFKISKLCKFQCMAYDFLNKYGKPVICEISYTFADWAVHSCPGYWDSNLNWVDGQMWPEEAQVKDFIEYLSK